MYVGYGVFARVGLYSSMQSCTQSFRSIGFANSAILQLDGSLNYRFSRHPYLLWNKLSAWP